MNLIVRITIAAAILAAAVPMAAEDTARALLGLDHTEEN